MSAEPSRAVFLSYASQDAEAARCICDALRAAGVEVWFDQTELRGGDAWDQKIRRQIRECALFVPIISTHTQARAEGYFRLEWHLAEQRTYLLAHDTPFLLPVVIDDTPEASARVPDRFRQWQWTRLGRDGADAAFCRQVLSLLSGEPPPAPAPVTVEAPRASVPAVSGRPVWQRWAGVAALGVLAIVAVTAWSPWRTRAPEPPRARQPTADRLPATTPLPAPSEKSVVVLPLENLSPDPADAFFTDGMHLELISTLQRISDLRVVSRNAALAFKGTTASLGEVAAKLRAANVITGSVRRANGQVRIQLELRQARDEALLWTKTYDRELRDVFAIQAEIADDIARVLQARGTSGVRGERFLARNPEAYDLYLKTLAHPPSRPSLQATEKFIATFQQVMSLDPTFMPAVSFASQASAQAYTMSSDPAAKLRHAQNAKRWAEEASRLTPGPFGDMAWVYYYTVVEMDNARSLALAEGVVRAQPNSAGSYRYLGNALRGAGRYAEALAAYRRERDFDARDPSTTLLEVNVLATLRRTDEWLSVLARNQNVSVDALTFANVAPTRFALTGTLPEAWESGSGMSRVDWLWLRRQFVEVITACDKQLSDDKSTILSRRLSWLEMKSKAQRRLGRARDAAETGASMLPLAQNISSEPAVDPSANGHWLARALLCAGRPNEAIVEGRRHVDAVSPTNQVEERWRRERRLAEFYAWAAQPRECIELLAKILRRPGPLTVHVLRGSPEWDDVREHEGFKALLADPANSAPL